VTRGEKPAARERQEASDQQPDLSLANFDNNSMVETGNFYFIFCFNDVNMLLKCIYS
jgi:hypothetical protein